MLRGYGAGEGSAGLEQSEHRTGGPQGGGGDSGLGHALRRFRAGMMTLDGFKVMTWPSGKEWMSGAIVEVAVWVGGMSGVPVKGAGLAN